MFQEDTEKVGSEESMDTCGFSVQEGIGKGCAGEKLAHWLVSQTSLDVETSIA